MGRNDIFIKSFRFLLTFSRPILQVRYERKKSSAVFIALRHFAGGVVVLEKTDFAGATTVSGRFTLSLAKIE